MVLSNWLTRDEWNACYFAGVYEQDGKASDLSQVLRAGIGALHRAGYAFLGIDSTSTGGYMKVTQCCDGNEAVLAEMITGDFDRLARAKEAVAFVEGRKDMPDFEWLKSAVVDVESGE